MTKSWVLRGKDNRRRVAGAKFDRDLGLCLGPYLAHHLVPFAVGKARGVVPSFDLAVETDVGPQMMAVRGDVQAVAARPRGFSKTGALKLKFRYCSDQSSGKARLSSVEREIGRALPIRRCRVLMPMIRSTVRTCLCRQATKASSISTSFSASW